MNKVWKTAIVLSLMGCCLWAWITVDLIDSVRCLRTDNLSMSDTISSLYERETCLYGRQNVLDETQLKAAQKDLELATGLTHLAGQDLRIVGVLENLTHKLQAVDARKAVMRAVGSVLMIYGGGGHGSGFFIDKAHGIILTAGHVAAHDCDDVLHVRQKNVDIPVLEARWDSFSDVGLVFVDPVLAQAFEANDVLISSVNVQIGDVLVSSGYPMEPERDPYSATGCVVGLDVNEVERVLGSKFSHAVKFHLEIIPGMSGGPILNVKGEVISINSVSHDGTQISCGPSSDQIRRAIIRMTRGVPIGPRLSLEDPCDVKE